MSQPPAQPPTRYADDRPVNVRRWAPALACLPLAVILDRVAAAAPTAVERLYTHLLYLPLSRALGALTDPLPYSLTEAMLTTLTLGAVGWVGFTLGALVARRRSFLNVALHLGVGILGLGGAGAVAFLALWGLNLHRLPVAAHLGLIVAPSPPEEVAALATELLDAASESRLGLRQDADGVVLLRGPVAPRAARGYDAIAATWPSLGGRFGRPKPLVFAVVPSYLGIAGFYSPLTAEAQLNEGVPAPTLPFVACHELAHQRGIVPEDEANFVGWLACREHPDPEFRYSAALTALMYTSGALSSIDPTLSQALWEAAPPGMIRDLDAIHAYNQKYKTPLATIWGKAHDASLRLQGQKEGLKTYGRVVDLLLAFRRAEGP